MGLNRGALPPNPAKQRRTQRSQCRRIVLTVSYTLGKMSTGYASMYGPDYDTCRHAVYEMARQGMRALLGEGRESKEGNPATGLGESAKNIIELKASGKI